MNARLHLNRAGRAEPIRRVVAGLALVAVAAVFVWQGLKLVAPAIATSSYWPTKGWRSSTPEAQGWDSTKLADGLQAIRENGTPIHSLLIVRNGSVFLDAYVYPYDGSIYHDLGSVTKSLITTLIGIAADQGKLDLDAPMVSFFPDRSIANRDDRKERVTVRHLASMSSGLKCVYEPDELTLEAMRTSPDWVQFALDLPMADEPGEHFAYCSPGMHLLSAILQEATGMSALDFARANLFEPLGITDVYWPADPQGYNHGWGDACLHPHDMAKLGFLFLNQGRWEGRQIVSRAWVEQATQAHMTGTGKVEDYGYGWWVPRPGNKYTFFRADGGGGQRILVIPAMEAVLVTTGGGFSLEEITPYVEAAIGDLEKPLPANPGGVARLKSVVAELGRPPAAKAVPPLPETAQAISGRTYMLAPNALSIRALRLDFDAPTEATFMLDLASEQGPRITGVGLDGVYRPSRSGRPVYARGYWADETTFAIEYNEGPGFNVHQMRARFDGDQVSFGMLGYGIFEGTLEQP